MYLQISSFFVFLIILNSVMFLSVLGQAVRNSRESTEIDWDVARQNRITQQILQYYLERKLFPQLKRPDSSKVPSASEILNRERNNYNYDKIRSKLNATRKREQEILQSVESERITSVYDNLIQDDDFQEFDNEGA